MLPIYHPWVRQQKSSMMMMKSPLSIKKVFFTHLTAISITIINSIVIPTLQIRKAISKEIKNTGQDPQMISGAVGWGLSLAPPTLAYPVSPWKCHTGFGNREGSL